MKKGFFQSKNTGQIKSVHISSEIEAELYLLRISFRTLGKKGTIQEWNELREEAKESFSKSVINALDASGFVSKWKREMQIKLQNE